MSGDEESVIRRIVANNESRGVNVPPRMWRALKLVRGDYVAISLEVVRGEECVVLRPALRERGVRHGA